MFPALVHFKSPLTGRVKSWWVKHRPKDMNTITILHECRYLLVTTLPKDENEAFPKAF